MFSELKEWILFCESLYYFYLLCISNNFYVIQNPRATHGRLLNDVCNMNIREAENEDDEDMQDR